MEIQTRGDLGPKQIRWLRDNIPSFDAAYRAVQATRADEQRALAKLRQEPKPQ